MAANPFDQFDVTPVATANTFDQFDVSSKRQNVSAEQPKSFGGFAGNVLTSGFNLAGGLYHAATNPVETAKNMGNLVIGGTLHTLNPNDVKQLGEFFGSEKELKEAMDFANSVGGMYKERYGSLDAILNTLYKDPVGAAGDISTLFTAGGGAATRLGKIAQLAPAATVVGGLSLTPSVSRLAAFAAPAARPIANAGKFLENVGEGAGKIGKFTNPLAPIGYGVEKSAQALSYPAAGLYNLAAPLFDKGAGVKARGYLEALGNDPTKIDAAIKMLQEGKTIEETAVALNSSGLASFARTSQDASTVIRDLYNARDAALKANQTNQLAGATENLNALNQANMPISQVSPNAPRRVVNQALSAEQQALAAEQAKVAGNVANVSQLTTGEQLAKANEAILANTKATVTGPAYDAAFQASPKATINVSNLATTAKGQIGDLLTQLKGLAPNASALLEEYGPKQVTVNMGEGVTAKTLAEPKLITLEDAHKIRQAINIDRAALKGSTEAAANTARLRLSQLYDEVNKSIKAGTSPEAFKLFEEANSKFKERIIGVHRTGQPTNLGRTSTLNEPMLLPENIVPTALNSEGNTRQFLKIYGQDPAALQTLKTGIEDLYRQEVLSPSASANAHSTFMFKNEKQLNALDETGMGIRARLDNINKDLTKVKTSEEALDLVSKTLNFKNINDLRTKVVADPMAMDMALKRMDAPAKSALARGIMQDTMAGVTSGKPGSGAKALENLTKNEETIMTALKAHDPKTAAKTFADAKQMADLYRLVEETGNKLPSKPGTVNALTTAKNINTLTEGLPEVKAAVEKIQQEIQNGADFEKLASQGKAAGGGANKLLTEEIGKQPTGFFGHTWSIANLVVNRLKGKIDNKLAVEIAQELANSETAAAALAKAQTRNVNVGKIKEPINAAANNSLNALRSQTALGITQLNQQNQNALGK
jgi:hypothetical protein